MQNYVVFLIKEYPSHILLWPGCSEGNPVEKMKLYGKY